MPPRKGTGTGSCAWLFCMLFELERLLSLSLFPPSCFLKIRVSRHLLTSYGLLSPLPFPFLFLFLSLRVKNFARVGLERLLSVLSCRPGTLR